MKSYTQLNQPFVANGRAYGTVCRPSVCHL